MWIEVVENRRRCLCARCPSQCLADALSLRNDIVFHTVFLKGQQLLSVKLRYGKGW